MNIEDLQLEEHERAQDSGTGRNAGMAAAVEPDTRVADQEKPLKVVASKAEQTFALVSTTEPTGETSERHQDICPGTKPEIVFEDIKAASMFDDGASQQLIRVNQWGRNGTFAYDGKQFRNAIYFAVSGFAMCLMLPSWNAPYLIPIASVFIFLSVLGLSFAFKPHSSGFYSSVTLSPLTRKLLRVVGLVLPIPFLMAGMLDIAARSEIVDGNKDFSASKYDSSLQHYTRASMMAPRNADAYIGQSNDYYRLENYNRAIETADKAIAIDPKKSYAWSDKARAQLALDAESTDAISNAEKAVSLNDQNGQAYGVLAQLYLNTADLDKALAAANAHIKVHPTEAQAFEVRADIFDQLGRTAEADADRGSMGTKY